MHIWQPQVDAWKKLDEVLIQHGLDSKVDKIVTVIQNAFFNDMIMFVSRTGISWLTIDCGKTYQRFQHSMKIKKIAFSPIKQDWLMITSTHRCKTGDVRCIRNNTERLYITYDLKTWKMIGFSVADFAWVASYTNTDSKIKSDSVVVVKSVGRNRWFRQHLYIYSEGK